MSSISKLGGTPGSNSSIKDKSEGSSPGSVSPTTRSPLKTNLSAALQATSISAAAPSPVAQSNNKQHLAASNGSESKAESKLFHIEIIIK